MKNIKIIPSLTLPNFLNRKTDEPLFGMGIFNMIKKEKICGIYKITSPSGKIYIGQSKDCLFRKTEYSRVRCKQQAKLYQSLLKYSWEAHVFEIIYECKKEELNNWEKYYVDFFKTFNTKHGLNLRDGGGNHATFSEETKKKMGDKSRGRIKSEETKRKQGRKVTGQGNGMYGKGDKLRGEKNGRYGKPVSDETRNKISEANKLYAAKRREEGINKLSDEHKEKIRQATLGNKRCSGRVLSDETKFKISKGNKGRKLSEESKKRMREAKQNMSKKAKANFKSKLSLAKIGVKMPKTTGNNHWTKRKNLSEVRS